jgi:SAM-dependent methyltransferase
MVKIAAGKFPQIQVLCGDVEEVDFGRTFDRIMVYNAFPHFPDPERLIRRLAGLLEPGGRLSVAHGMSRAALSDHHAGRAASVSIDLISETELADIFSRWFDVDVVISDDRMYQVSGIRKVCPIEDVSANPLSEELVLLKFMISHNDAHAQELTDMAFRLKESGKENAYQEIMKAVAEFDAANARLSSIMKDLS